MAKIEGNCLTQGLTGTFGDNLCFRQVNGKTQMYSRPRKRPGSGTPGQARARDGFRKSQAYAREVIADPSRKELYERKATLKGKRAFNLAMRDYGRPPEVKQVATDGYCGRIGDVFTAHASDDFMVVQVMLTILDRKGDVVEEGLMKLHNNNVSWVYVTTVRNEGWKDCKVVVVARDLPGNERGMEVLMGQGGKM